MILIAVTLPPGKVSMEPIFYLMVCYGELVMGDLFIFGWIIGLGIGMLLNFAKVWIPPDQVNSLIQDYFIENGWNIKQLFLPIYI